jgi:glycosyltransferase involved in cell wall biosynthesis
MSTVSIITPVFNDVDVLSRLFNTLESYLEYPWIEVILVDDSSTDGSYETCKIWVDSLQKQNLFLLKTTKNSGPAFARNLGILQASCHYVAFLDSDDGWHPDKLFVQMKTMETYGAKLCGTGHQVLASVLDLTNLEPITHMPISTITWPGVLWRSPFSTPSVMVERSVLMEDRFCEVLRGSEDFNLWMRIAKKHKTIKLQAPLTYTFKHDYMGPGQGLSSRLWMMEKNELKNYGLLFSQVSLFWYEILWIHIAQCVSILKFFKRVGQKSVLCASLRVRKSQ